VSEREREREREFVEGKLFKVNFFSVLLSSFFPRVLLLLLLGKTIFHGSFYLMKVTRTEDINNGMKI